jgi:hypothetical protein
MLHGLRAIESWTKHGKKGRLPAASGRNHQQIARHSREEESCGPKQSPIGVAKSVDRTKYNTSGIRTCHFTQAIYRATYRPPSWSGKASAFLGIGVIDNVL